MKAQSDPKSRNPLTDWYSPYFGPVTLVLAAIVLVISIEVGKYFGAQYLHRHPITFVTTPAATHVTAKPSRR